MRLKTTLLFIILASLLFSCKKTDDNTKVAEEVIVIDPLATTKELLQKFTFEKDSVFYEENDSTITYYIIPKSEEYEPGKEIYGAFTIEKNTLTKGDLTGDGKDDFVIQYTFTPHLENNTLTYFKVLVQTENGLTEAGEIFGGGRCEGPILQVDNIQKQTILFKGLEYAEGDPCCCPSIEKQIAYQLTQNGIEKINTK